MYNNYQYFKKNISKAYLLSFIALIYTTPWDNYLVYKKVWDYGKDRILFTIFYVPFEEYCFFILQPLLITGIFLYMYPNKDSFKKIPIINKKEVENNKKINNNKIIKYVISTKLIIGFLYGLYCIKHYYSLYYFGLIEIGRASCRERV